MRNKKLNIISKVNKLNKRRALAGLLVVAIVVSLGLLIRNNKPDQRIGDIVEQDAYSVKTFQGENPDGTAIYEIETSLTPQRFKNDKNEWIEYDTTLVKSDGEYQYKLASSDHQAYFKGSINDGSVIRVEKENIPLEMKPQSLYYVNNQGNQQLIAHPDLSSKTEINDNVITYKNIYGNGIDLRFTSTNTKILKELVINSLEALPQPTIQNAYLELKLSIDIDENTKIMLPAEKGTSEWTDTNAETDIKDGIIFTDQNGARLYSFPPAIARDSKSGKEMSLTTSNGTEDSKLEFTLRKENDDLTASVKTPYS